MEQAATSDEPVPLKAASNNSASGDDVISAASNGVAVGHDSSMHMLVNGHSDAVAATNASSDVQQTSF